MRATRARRRITSIFTHLVNFCWSLFKWTLLLILLGGGAVGGYLYFRLDDEIRRQVELRFANHYKDFVVRVGSARFDSERGIAIDNFSLTPKESADGSAEPVLSIDELYLAGNLRIEQLVANQLQIDDVVVRRAHMRIARAPNGEWNTSKLLPLPHFSDSMPRISVEDATATVNYNSVPGVKPWLLQGINLKLTPLAADAATSDKRFQIEGVANGPPARELHIKGDLDAGNGAIDVLVTAGGLDITQELIANLSASAAEKMKGMDVSGQANVSLGLRRANAQSPAVWSADFNVQRGRLVLPALPEAVTEIAFTGHADPQRLAIRDMTARLGSANIAMALNRSGWAENSPVALSANVAGFTLNEELEHTLPESFARIWKRFRPIGQVDATVRLTFDGSRWQPDVTAECRGISLTDTKTFPYQVEQSTGKVIYRGARNGKPDELLIDVTGVGGRRPIRVDVALTHLAPEEPEGVTTDEGVAVEESAAGRHVVGYSGVRYKRAPAGAEHHPLGYVQVSGEDISLHEALLQALPVKAQELVTALHAQGAIDFKFRAEWKDFEQRTATTTLDIPLKDLSIRYDPFSMPLEHVHGLLKAENWHWTLNDVEACGINNSAVMKCRGGAVPHDSGCELDLVFEARNVPLDDNLNSALPPGGRLAWAELRPRGRIDFDAHVTRQPNELEPQIEVTMRPCEQTVSIEPRMLPYRLDQIKGQAVYKRGQVTFQNVIASHNRSTFSVGTGTWTLLADGGWQLDFNNCNVDRLTPDREMVTALPPALQSIIERLQPSGTIDVSNSNLSLVKLPQGDRMSAKWDLNLECQQAALQTAVPIQGINGRCHLVGQFDGHNAFGAGELDLDTILYKNVQLTKVRGPFWADSVHCLFGEPACLQLSKTPQRMVADAYGGGVAANVELVHSPSPSYKLDLQLGGINVGRLANERLGGSSNVNGTLSGKVLVNGNGSSTQTLTGAGELQVVDANLYELPIFVAMLKVLRNRAPDTAAFNRCDIKFDIKGDHIQFDQLNLRGDAASLYGKGEADLSRKLNLEFYTLIGPADLPIPLWKSIAGHVSKQWWQLKVVGTLDEPKIERKALPAVNDMLNQLQTDIQDGAATMTPTAARPAHPAAK